MAKSKRKANFKPSLTDEQLVKIIEDAWTKYEGDTSVIESAIGALCIGRFIGWQPLRLLHPSAYKNYEKVLGIEFWDVLPKRGPDDQCLAGMKLVDDIGKFWLCVSGSLVPAHKLRMKTA